MEKKGRVFSGMRPTGRLHLGNLFGALTTWVELQDEYECFYGIVDWHALTTAYEEPEELGENIREIVIDWLSVGLDPERSVLMLQSKVKEHAELHLLLSMLVPVPWLERVPTYKDQVKQFSGMGKDIATYGFLGYPVLMAADILVYKATAVPVGEDQVPHIELTREIARRFNHLYGTVFPEPQAMLNEVPVLPGIDGRKMSKSYGNEILISARPEEIRERVQMMVTDPARVKRNDPGHPEVCSVYEFHKVFTRDRVTELDAECRRAGIGCVDCKGLLVRSLTRWLEPIYARRRQIESNPSLVREVLEEGSKKAKVYAGRTLEEVRVAMKIGEW